MSERIILPLERALQRAYSARKWILPERTGRRLVLMKKPRLMSSYSTEAYPANATTGEMFRLSRRVVMPKREGETFDAHGSIDLYMALMNQYEDQAINIAVARNKVPKDAMNADVVCGVLVFNKLRGAIKGLKAKYHDKRNEEITPELLGNMASDYLDFAAMAFKLASPTEER